MADNTNNKRHIVICGKGGGGSSTVTWDDIQDKPEFATVATSGDYDDLENRPTILTQWFGTQAEYDLIDPKDPNTIYNIEGSDNVQADWNQSDTTADDYIKNKPTIPAAQVNSDWNANSGVAQILNKPTIPVVPAMTTETLTFTMQDSTTKTITFFTAITGYFYVEDASGSDNTLSIVKNNENAPTIEVFASTDQMSWTSMGSTSTTAITATIPANGKLYLKATTSGWSTSVAWTFNTITASGNHNIGGNIMSLLNGDNFEGTTLNPLVTNNLQSLFSNNTTLVSAEELILPTNVVDGCYVGMFEGCTALTTAPALPATTLAENCYGNMFDGCTALTTAPELPATTLAQRCYQYMFIGCTALNSVTTYATNISATQCTLYWLSGVAATGDFYNLGGATYESGTSGIPSGWTEHTSL